MTDYPNGIYVGLPFDDYLKIERLSKTSLKKILISPADFWCGSWLDPNPPRLTPEQERRRFKARLLGNAYHCARLEPDRFPLAYARAISKADFEGGEGFVGTASEIGMQLAAFGEAKSKAGEGVLDQAARLKAAGYKGAIWHLIEAENKAEIGTRIPIDAMEFDQILIDMTRIAAVPEAHDALTGGIAEVSILYDCPDTGLPMKARLDYLRRDGWAEFKSFSNPNGKGLDQCLLDAIKYNRYYIDIACYDEAVEQIRLGAISMIHGDFTPEQASIVAMIRSAERPLRHNLIFQQKDGVPNILLREIELREIPPASQLARIGSPTEADVEHGDAATERPTAIMQKAQREIAQAKRLFREYSEIYERGEPWLPPMPEALITDLDFSPYFLEVK